jgi:preprotein translocase subunit SecF
MTEPTTDHGLLARIDERLAGLVELLAERDLRYQQRFDAQEKATANAFESAKEAVLKAEAAAKDRFESVNEFRAQLGDQAATFMRRTEAEARMDAGDERLQLQVQANAVALEKLTAVVNQQVVGKALGINAVIAIVVALIVIIGGGLAILAALR